MSSGFAGLRRSRFITSAQGERSGGLRSDTLGLRPKSSVLNPERVAQLAAEPFQGSPDFLNCQTQGGTALALGCVTEPLRGSPAPNTGEMCVTTEPPGPGTTDKTLESPEGARADDRQQRAAPSGPSGKQWTAGGKQRGTSPASRAAMAIIGLSPFLLRRHKRRCGNLLPPRCPERQAILSRPLTP